LMSKIKDKRNQVQACFLTFRSDDA